MPDNTTLNANTTSGDVISTDELTSLNGGAVSGQKVQRVKVGFGSDGALRDVDASNGLPISGNLNELRAATLAVTATGAAAAAVTLTIPAAGVGLFHYITALEIRLYSTAARTGVAAPIVVTTTNLPGTLAFTFETAGAIGTSVVQSPPLATPLRSSAANTATTIVAPAVTGGIWRITAFYFTAV
jgi:hypothetical protein